MRINCKSVAHGNSYDTAVEEREVSEVPLRDVRQCLRAELGFEPEL